MKKIQETELTMDMILTMTPEEFRDTVKAQPLGFNKSLLNLLKAQYEQCNISKESLSAVVEKAEVPTEDMQEYERTIHNLYVCMQLIEDRHTILDLLIKEVEE